MISMSVWSLFTVGFKMGELPRFDRCQLLSLRLAPVSMMVCAGFLLDMPIGRRLNGDAADLRQSSAPSWGHTENRGAGVRGCASTLPVLCGWPPRPSKGAG